MQSGARGKIIVGITHFLVVEPSYYIIIILKRKNDNKKYRNKLGCGLS